MKVGIKPSTTGLQGIFGVVMLSLGWLLVVWSKPPAGHCPSCEGTVKAVQQEYHSGGLKEAQSRSMDGCRDHSHKIFCQCAQNFVRTL